LKKKNKELKIIQSGADFEDLGAKGQSLPSALALYIDVPVFRQHPLKDRLHPIKSLHRAQIGGSFYFI
jgi:hypothetical protein